LGGCRSGRPHRPRMPVAYVGPVEWEGGRGKQWNDPAGDACRVEGTEPQCRSGIDELTMSRAGCVVAARVGGYLDRHPDDGHDRGTGVVTVGACPFGGRDVMRATRRQIYGNDGPGRRSWRGKERRYLTGIDGARHKAHAEEEQRRPGGSGDTRGAAGEEMELIRSCMLPRTRIRCGKYQDVRVGSTRQAIGE